MPPTVQFHIHNFTTGKDEVYSSDQRFGGKFCERFFKA
jgi:hypothetical protein